MTTRSYVGGRKCPRCGLQVKCHCLSDTQTTDLSLYLHSRESRGEPDLSDLSHGYPFLDLSRVMGVDYGAVLRVANRLDSGCIDPDNSRHLEQLATEEGLPVRVVCLVERVCSAPWRWQFPPQGRGL